MTTTEKQTPRWLEYRRIDALVPDDRNPKSHDLEQLRASLGRFGYTAPIELDERTGQLVSGHGRTELLLAEHQAGSPLPDGIVVDGDGMWLAPVVRGWSSANDDEAAAYIIAANRLVETGGWRSDALVPLLQQLDSLDVGLAGIGFDGDDLTRLADELERSTNVSAHSRRLTDRDDVDDLPPVPDEPVTRHGDVWQLGDHRIMCGDSRDPDDVAKLMRGEQAHVLFTSPPYNVGVKYTDYDDSTKPWDEYRPLLDGVLAASVPHLIDGGAVCWNIGVSRKMHPARQLMLLEDHGLAYVRTMLWRKSGTSLSTWQHTEQQSRARVFTPSYTFEFVYVYARGDALAPGGPIEVTDALKYDTFVINQREATEGLPRTDVPYRHAETTPVHTAAFPVALPAAFINALADVGAPVLDPFAGVGSTLLAAHDERRLGRCMELSPAYVDVACMRWERLTGIVPVRAETGDPVSFVDV